MSSIETIANDSSLNTLFADYLTCCLSLERARSGQATISKAVQLSLSRRLRDITLTMLREVRKQHHDDQPTTDTVHKAAIHLLKQHPSGPDYFLGRLGVR